MKFKFKFVPHLLALVVTLTAGALSFGTQAWAYGFPRGYLTQNGAEALAAAEVSGKPILIYFTQPDCSWCDKVEILLDQPESRKLLSSAYHFMDIDIQRSKDNVAKALLADLKVKGTPAFGVINPSGKVLCMHYGNIRNADELLLVHTGIQTLAKAGKTTSNAMPNCRGQAAPTDADISAVSPKALSADPQ